ncbi:MAG: alpha/beta fold hydrolase [Kofleriaceae bacterium]|nr:alpha/beta fold hydrolase [Kofleriaceae bacterium]
MKLICFPFAGGSSLAFRGWGTSLGVEVIAASLPGREARSGEPLHTRMEPLVADLVERLAPKVTGTYALYGHSMGGRIAFAFTRELARRGLPGPVQLIISGTGAPHLPRRVPSIHAEPEPVLVARLRAFGGTPQAVLDEPELLAYFLPILRADLAVAETYRVDAHDTVSCPILAISGTEDPFANREEVEAWATLTTSRCEAQFFPGGHFFIDTQRPALFALVRRALAAGTRNPPTG